MIRKYDSIPYVGITCLSHRKISSLFSGRLTGSLWAFPEAKKKWEVSAQELVAVTQNQDLNKSFICFFIFVQPAELNFGYEYNVKSNTIMPPLGLKELLA